MKIKKLILTFLAVATVFTMASCKEDEKEKTLVKIDTEDPIIAQLEKNDFNGYKFRIFTRKNMLNDQYVAETTGDIVIDATFKRNATIEALYNVEITGTESASQGSSTEALTTIQAGDDQYDVILTHSGSAFTYAARNAALNLTDIKSLKLEKEWWSQDMQESCKINNHLYVIDGDFNMQRLDLTMCLFFNKDLFDELGLAFPYEMAENGTWTFDEFAKLVRRGKKDLNGDGVMNIENDRYGFYTTDWDAPICIIYTGGQRIITNNRRGVPEITLNSPKTVDIYTNFFNLCNSDSAFLRTTTGGTRNSTDIPVSAPFTEGRALFYGGSLGSAQSFRSMKNEFGILPYPKYSLDDDYATVVNGASSLLLIPITVEDPERTGTILEAMCALGYNYVLPEYYNKSLKTKFARDNESEAMIDIIRESIIYDLGYTSGSFGALSQMGWSLSQDEKPDFTSKYKAVESSSKKNLETFLENYAALK